MHQSHLPLPISSLNGGHSGCQQHAHPLPVRTHQAVGERSQVQSARQHGPSTAPEWTPPLEQAVSGLPQVEGVEGSASHGPWVGHTVHMANGGQHVQGVQVGVCPLCVPWEWHWRGSGPGTGALRLDQKRAFILQCITPQTKAQRPAKPAFHMLPGYGSGSVSMADALILPHRHQGSGPQMGSPVIIMSPRKNST